MTTRLIGFLRRLFQRQPDPHAAQQECSRAKRHGYKGTLQALSTTAELANQHSDAGMLRLNMIRATARGETPNEMGSDVPDGAEHVADPEVSA